VTTWRAPHPIRSATQGKSHEFTAFGRVLAPPESIPPHLKMCACPSCFSAGTTKEAWRKSREICPSNRAPRFAMIGVATGYEPWRCNFGRTANIATRTFRRTRLESAGSAPTNAPSARIASRARLNNVCPNCGGGFVPRADPARQRVAAGRLAVIKQPAIGQAGASEICARRHRSACGADQGHSAGRAGDRFSRHCEHSEAIQGCANHPWIASLRSQ